MGYVVLSTEGNHLLGTAPCRFDLSTRPMNGGQIVHCHNDARRVRELPAQRDRIMGALKRLVRIAELPESAGIVKPRADAGVVAAIAEHMGVMPVCAIQLDPSEGVLPARYRIAEMLMRRPGGVMRLQEHFRVASPFGDRDELGA